MENEPMRKTLGFFFMLWITASAKAMPDPEIKNELSSSKNLVGVATQVISNAMLNVQADSTSNLIFSPLGYATILSILGQGSVGETRDEIYRVLEQPTNDVEILNAYRNTLNEYTGKDPMIAPQFKTWFYIYKNVSHEEKFRKLIEENYHVEARDIDRFEDENFEDAFRTDESAPVNEKPTNSKDIIQFEDLKNTESKDAVEVEGFDTLKIADDDENTTTDSIAQAITDYEELNKDEKNQITKFDKHVDDEQYVDVPVIKKDLAAADGPEKISLPTKKYLEDSSDEIMIAAENRKFVSRFGRARPLHLDGDVTSALSGNSVMGKKEGKSKDQFEAKMLLFNGLYFRGEWAQPFSLLSDKKKFEAVTGEQEVNFMMSEGSYKFAEIPSKQITAVEIPYKNEKYSLMIVMADTYKDMKYFIKNSDYNLINEISAHLEPTDLSLFVPKFRVEYTSKADKALGQLGLKSIFTPKSDLRGISKDADGFFIEELVQHVAIKVDEGFSSENALSATSIQGRKNLKSNEIVINRPFLFFVRDLVNDVILTAGKIVEIPDEEIPVTFKV